MGMTEEKLADGTEIAIMCPRCARPLKLVVRTIQSTGKRFIVCPNRPSCGYTARLPQNLLMELQGTAPLSGFE